MKLLQRMSRVKLTPVGEALLRDGTRILSQAQRAIQAARAAGREQVTVGFGGSAASGLLPDVLRIFSERYPSDRALCMRCSAILPTAGTPRRRARAPAAR